jgi:glutaredoxin
MTNVAASKTAILYRMVTTEHICPYGVASKNLLERQGFQVDDRHLTSRAEVDDFEAKHHVNTTPLTFIDGKRIGGFDDLSAFLG